MRQKSAFLAVLGLLTLSESYGLDANAVFKKVSPSIYVVVSQDASGRTVSQGSGVLVGKNLIVTNCHVVQDAGSIVLVQKDIHTKASLKYKDIERDLCMLATEREVAAQPVVISTSTQLERGKAVYAVGAPLGLELTISDGIVSGLRKAVGGFIIQTSAATSPGSSGGGLFDDSGRLVGITTYQYAKGQNLNFAVPAEWIQQISVRESFEKNLRARRKAYADAVGELGTIGEIRETDQKVAQLSKTHLETDPNHIPALFNLGLALGKENRSMTETVYVKLIDLPPESIDDYFLIGFGALDLSGLYGSSGRPELARIAAAKAATFVPLLPVLGNYWSYLKTPDDYREAVGIYTLAIDLFPRSQEAWAYLGASYMNLNEGNKAIRAFREATQLQPDYEWAWLGYMITLRKTRDKAEMERVIQYLENNQPDILSNILKAFKNE